MNYNYNTQNQYSSNFPGLFGQGQQGWGQGVTGPVPPGTPIGQSRPTVWGLPHEKGNPMNDLVYNKLAKEAMVRHKIAMKDSPGTIFFPPEVRQLNKEDATKYLDQYWSSFSRNY